MKVNGEFEMKLEIHRRLHGVGRVGDYNPLNQQPSDQTISQPTNHHNKPASQAASHSASQPASHSGGAGADLAPTGASLAPISVVLTSKNIVLAAQAQAEKAEGLRGPGCELALGGC